MNFIMALSYFSMKNKTKQNIGILERWFRGLRTHAEKRGPEFQFPSIPQQPGITEDAYHLSTVRDK